MFHRASSRNPTIPKCRLGSAFCSAEKLGTIRYALDNNKKNKIIEDKNKINFPLTPTMPCIRLVIVCVFLFISIRSLSSLCKPWQRCGECIDFYCNLCLFGCGVGVGVDVCIWGGLLV